MTPPNQSSPASLLAEVTLGFIGAGNMARSLIGGLRKQGIAGSRIIASDPSVQCLAAVRELGAQTTSDNAELVTRADVVVLAIKPQVMASVLLPLASTLQQRQPLLVSIAAGINCSSLQAWAGEAVPVIRCMPNTPALLQCGATGLYASAQVSTAQRKLAEAILAAVGLAVWVDDEKQLDAVTAVSGSGPAYFFLLMEYMQKTGEQLGLPPATARALTLQTALGAANMALNAEVDVSSLREQVTSPNGTTQAAIESFQQQGLEKMVSNALAAAHRRSEALAEELG